MMLMDNAKLLASDIYRTTLFDYEAMIFPLFLTMPIALRSCIYG